MVWQEPICDRTAEDVSQHRPKGYCNVSDLVRLDGNCIVLGQLLGQPLFTRATPWAITDFPTAAELARIVSNIRRLQVCWQAYQTTPQPPENPLNQWEKWNAAEAITRDIYLNFNDNQSARSYSGELWAGNGIGVI